MAVDRYATNAFTNFADYEGNDLKAGKVLKGDNPDFLYPPKVLRTASGSLATDIDPITKKPVDRVGSHTQKVQRGYMRMLSQGFKGGSPLSKRRLHFQFNPDTIVRHVEARQDVQLWMNQDPVQLLQPMPGTSNFAFDLLFNREAEIASGKYRAGSEVLESTAKAVLPLKPGAKGTSSDIPHSAVTDIGVLADLIVFDDIIGQGINMDLINKVITNANSVNAARRAAAEKAGTGGTTPDTSAQATVTIEANKIKTITITQGGTGYISAPEITLSGGNGTGAKFTATVAGGAVTEIKIDNAGTGFTSVPGVSFTGGGDGSGTSGDGTSDSQDIPPKFDEDDARTNLTNNFGNSAFLVSLPIRIVFSSLFMVEGYITSTTVTFNKFNPNMVPTQCTVGIQMQAMYMGFAKKDTFLTLSLAQGLKAAQEALTEAGETDSDPEVAAVEKLGKALFQKNVKRGSTGSTWSPDEGDDVRENIGPWQIYERADYIQTIALKINPTKELKETLKRGSIKDIDYSASWKITYLGNTNTATPLGNSMGIVKNETLATIYKTGSFGVEGIGDLKDKTGDTLVMQFVGNALPAGKKVDSTATSKYRVEFRIIFTVQTTSGESIPCSQAFDCNLTTTFNATTDKPYASRKGSMVTKTTKWEDL
jgi:hypothetical protein